MACIFIWGTFVILVMYDYEKQMIWWMKKHGK